MSEKDLDELLNVFADDQPLAALGRRIGTAALAAVLEELGGQTVYLPRKKAFASAMRRRVRDEEIRAKFNGRNHDELALAYGIDARQVRRIVSAEAAAGGQQRTGLVRMSSELIGRLQELADGYGVSVREVADAVVDEGLGLVSVERAVQRRFAERGELGDAA